MPFLKHARQAARRPAVRASAVSALRASTQLPNSGFRFVDNAQGSSAAISEMSRSLDVALEQFDSERTLGDQLELQLSRLCREAEKYANSRVAEDTVAFDEWRCSPAAAEIVAVAFACSAAVYDPEAKPSVPGFAVPWEERVLPTAGGTVKSTAMYVFEQLPSEELLPRHPLLPMLVVAIRGTASGVDHMVNLNSKAKAVDSLFAVEDLLPSKEAERFPLSAHSGFLNSAEALLPTLSKHVTAVIENRGVRHVLFTGHSAGGAVASLLFARYLSRASADTPSIRFSSITFGAPPVLCQSLTPHILDNPRLAANRGLVLSVVNEHDLVARVDGAYVLSLVDLYRSIYKLASIQDEEHLLETLPPRLPRLSFDPRKHGDDENDDDDGTRDRKKARVWKLPRPEYRHMGALVVLKVALADRECEGDGEEGEEEAEDGDDGEDELVLRAVLVKPDDFERFLFCHAAVHSRARYKERVDLLLQGRFNGREGWD